MPISTPYRSDETEAWSYAIPYDGWSLLAPVTRTVQFCTIEAAEAYLGVTLHSEKE